MTEGECMIRIMKENTEYLELFIIIVDDTKFQQDQENLIFFQIFDIFYKIYALYIGNNM